MTSPRTSPALFTTRNCAIYSIPHPSGQDCVSLNESFPPQAGELLVADTGKVILNHPINVFDQYRIRCPWAGQGPRGQFTRYPDPHRRRPGHQFRAPAPPDDRSWHSRSPTMAAITSAGSVAALTRQPSPSSSMAAWYRGRRLGHGGYRCGVLKGRQRIGHRAKRHAVVADVGDGPSDRGLGRRLRLRHLRRWCAATLHAGCLRSGGPDRSGDHPGR